MLKLAGVVPKALQLAGVVPEWGKKRNKFEKGTCHYMSFCSKKPEQICISKVKFKKNHRNNAYQTYSID